MEGGSASIGVQESRGLVRLGPAREIKVSSIRGFTASQPVFPALVFAALVPTNPGNSWLVMLCSVAQIR